ncbi:MAG: DUF3617 family protein [Novosphingobium sp.]|nr:DUF3617 family protein [Novosphingobium sp.]
MRKRFILGFVALSGFASAQTGGGEMKAGLWKETTFLSMVNTSNGRPLFVAPGETSNENHCYSEEDMRRNAMLLAGADECDLSDLKMAGGKLSIRSRCDVGRGVTFDGVLEGTYDATSLHIAGSLQGGGTADKIEMRVKMDAVHIGGSCEADD